MRSDRLLIDSFGGRSFQLDGSWVAAGRLPKLDKTLGRLLGCTQRQNSFQSVPK